MANEVSIINSVTKKERNGIYVYTFPLVVIEADPDTDVMTIISQDRSQNREVAFADITDPLGAGDIEGYVDALAAGGYYTIPSSAAPAELAAIETNTGDTATNTASIDTKSTTIVTNTGNTAASVGSIDTKSTTIATNTDTTATNTGTIAGAVITDGGHTGMRVVIDEDYTTLSNELSVADTNIKLSLKQTHDNLPLFYDRVNGAATQTYDPVACHTIMSVVGGTDYAIAQSFMRPNYTASTTHCAKLTVSNFHIQTDVYKRIGLFNGGTTLPYSTYDGVYLESDGVTNKIYACYANAGSVTRTEIINTATAYGFTLDWTKLQAVLVRYLYLGGTALEFSVVVGPRTYRIAQIQLSNVISSPFILRPNQPVRYEIRSAGGAGTMNQTCAAVYKLGDGTIEGITRAVLHPGGVNYASAGTEYALMAFKKKSTHLSVEVQLTSFDIAVATAETFQYQLVLNPTITNAPAYTAVTNSAVEYFTGASNTTITGGTVLFAGTATELANNSTLFPNNLTIGHSIAGVSDVFVISIIPRTGGITPTASAGWHEAL